MKKRLLVLLIILCSCTIARADHITGGEMYYKFVSSSGGLYTYSVTLKLYMRCNSGRQFNNPSTVSVFNRATGARAVPDIRINLSRTEQIKIANPDPCITNPPTVCYDVGYYEFQVIVPSSTTGYLLASQVNYRINTITNLTPGYRNIGATYTAEIPGTESAINGAENNGAQFVGSDLVVVCANNPMTYSFAAKDNDGDRLRYSFCDAYQSTNTGTGTAPSSSSFPGVPYGPMYSGQAPLGENVKINSSTGLITGIAPRTGVYVVTVCVEEIRNGVVIARQRKDLQINIAACDIAAAVLEPEYSLCKETKTYTFSNLSTNNSITGYSWEFINSQGNVVSNSKDPTVTYTFPDTGIYTIQLSITRGSQCTGTTTAVARVYPGFVPGFTYSGVCYNKPTSFTDLTTSAYGTVNKWDWNFGESSGDDVSDKQNPAFTYSTNGDKNVKLVVENSVGCRDTLVKTVAIIDKPPVNLAFRDTLICINDQVQLKASGSGNFTWTPNETITNANTPSPTVSPRTTRTYYVNQNDNGCMNNDSVLVRVTDRVNLQLMNDTTICQGDSIILRTTSDGFKYSWTPAAQLVDPTAKNPLVFTTSPTTYEITASIGGCTAKRQINVTTVPYPFTYAGRDTILCFGNSTALTGVTNGSSFRWSPNATLSNPVTLNPLARPTATTSYVLTATDTRGCPKPSFDTVLVTVMPNMNTFAGRDTSVIVGQPLQLLASGGDAFTWSPSAGLSATNIHNPVALYSQPIENIRYKILASNEAGCADSAFLNVKVFAGGPTIYIPTAFTPNDDGKNDVLKPIAAGIKQIEFFSIYNRWGQMLYRSSENNRGWDGTFGGVKQAPGVFVWMVKAVDFNNKPYFQKGTVALIR